MGRPRYAVVTLAVHDMNGFAELGTITVEEYFSATQGPQYIDQAENHGCILDLWDRDSLIADKPVTLQTAADLLGWPAETLIQRGRQILAQTEDEASEWLDARPRERAEAAA